MSFLSKTALTGLCAAGLLAAGAASAQQQTVLIGFEGATPFANVPAAAPFPAATIGRLGDTGVQTSAYGLAPTQGTQFALLTTFSNGGGSYPAGSPVFGGAGAVAGANTLWNFAFPGSTTNQLAAAGAVSGSVLTLSITMAVGDSISVDYRFLTSEPATGGNADFAWAGFRLGNTGNPQQFAQIATPALATQNSPSLNFDTQTALVGSFGFTATTAGTYNFAFGVADGGAEGVQSGLFLDNVIYRAIPEPGTYALLVTGALALGMAVRRRRA